MSEPTIDTRVPDTEVPPADVEMTAVLDNLELELAQDVDLDDTLVIDESDGGVPEATLTPTRLIQQFEPQNNVQMDASPYEKPKGPVDHEEALSSLNATVEQINDQLSALGIDLLDDNTTLPPRYEILRRQVMGLKNTLQLSYFRQSVKREDALWKQSAEHEGIPLRASKVVLRKTDDPVLRIRNELGMGGLVQIPLWHSGIWLTLRTPSDKALLELERRISADKIDLGRRSNGMVFSSTEVYATTHITDFVLEHLHTTNVEAYTPELLKSLIRVTDIPQMAWGILLAIYPKGYPLTQPCIADPDKCDHIIEQLINIGRISWVDTTKLTPRQCKHMSARVAKWSAEKIMDYQQEFIFGANANIPLNDRISIRLHVPSLQQAQESGYAWVDGITTTTQKAFNLRLKEDEREGYIREQALLTGLRQYSHWIGSVVNASEDGEEEVIADAEVLDDIIETICASEELTDKVYRAILNYIDGCTISLIALPRYKCPACQKEPSPEYLKHPHLIPLDVIYVFFILRVQKLTRKMVAEQYRAI